MLSPSGQAYKRVIRLEGQVITYVRILRFLARYQINFPTATDLLLAGARDRYFDHIEELIGDFLSQGLDLVREAQNTERFINLMSSAYFGDIRDKEERERNHHWPKILWFLALQAILEDENLSVAEVIVKGYEWFLDSEQYPARYGCAEVFSMTWHLLSAERKQQFLQSLTLDKNKLGQFLEGLEKIDLNQPPFERQEGVGCMLEFKSLDLQLDADHPNVTPPDTARHMPKCQRCDQQLRKDEIGGNAEHRPVQTTCGHLFGYICLRKWFETHPDCPQCGKELSGLGYPASAQEVLESCDRELKWIHPPLNFVDAESPNSALEQLALVLEPVAEIQRRLRHWGPYSGGMPWEWARLRDTGAYLARERLRAVMQKRGVRYRQAVRLQVQVGARRLWLDFLERVLPE
jgi:hypothetical protein